MARRVVNDVEYAFDKVIDLYQEDIAASGQWVSEVERVAHLTRIVGQITNDFDTDEGELEIIFYRDENGLQEVGKLQGYIDVGTHDVDIIPFADYMKVTIGNADTGESHQVTVALAGFLPEAL